MNQSTEDRQGYSPSRAIDSVTITEQVYLSLREDIISNRLAPGTRLQEIAIAQGFDVSRGPVREAFRRLDAEGLVDVLPRKGAVVNSLTREEFLDAYQVRETLEILGIRLAVPRCRSKDFKALEDLHQEMIDSSRQEDLDTFFSANARFHNFIIKLSGNKKLIEIYRTLDDQMRRYRMSSLYIRGGLMRSCDEHLAIIKAMRTGDIVSAERLIHEHISIPQKILESNTAIELTTVSQQPAKKNQQDEEKGINEEEIKI